ncbi:MAG: hypothetical protein AB1453_14080 [Chloroflexota bacterium]
MNEYPANDHPNERGFPYLLGLGLVSVGLAIFLEQFLKTGWLVLVIAPISGAVLIIEAIRLRKLGLLIAGGLTSGLGIGTFFFFSSIIQADIEQRVGWLITAFAFGWISITLFTRVFLPPIRWWALIPGGILLSIGLCFIISRLRVVDFVLYITLGVGIVLLGWGVFWRLFGLIIPGSLLLTIGPGIYYAWGTDLAANALSKTGMMIAIFALGWGFIILFSRVVTTKFIWWPLIPGGVLAVVGWGLYVGGDPGNAVSFIANTGSIGLIIFGLYLLLLRKSLHH